MADMRDAIAAAIDGNVLEDDDNLDAPGTGDEEIVEPTGGEDAPIDTPPVDPRGNRDALGRFTKPDGTPAPIVQAPVPTDPQQQVLPPVNERAPVSWSPAAREEWKNLSPVARAEVMKRESEIQRTMSESADARNIAQQVVEVMRPHLARVQQNGMSPFQAIGNIFQIEESLAVGSMAVKAATIAQLVKSYNIDIQALDSALAGAPLPADTQVQSQVQELLRREMAPFQQMMQQAQQRRANMQRQYEEQAASELDTFAADPKNEFLDDVKDAMADIIELGVRRGVDISTADAYAQACQFDPRVKAVIASRNTRTTSISAAAAARKARAAAVSISGAPVIGDDVTKTPDHLRGAIEAAMEVHSTR